MFEYDLRKIYRCVVNNCIHTATYLSRYYKVINFHESHKYFDFYVFPPARKVKLRIEKIYYKTILNLNVLFKSGELIRITNNILPSL